MRKTTATPLLIHHWLNGIFLVLLIGLMTTPAMAVLSDKTGQIQGQAPTVTGSLQVLFPDGETVLADNAILELNQIPNQFRVSLSTAGLVLQDADDDIGLSALADIEHATLTWKHDGTELTPTQLAAPLWDNFSGQTLTLEVSAPVTVSSVTGLPTTAEPRILTGSYTLKVAAVFAGVSVNGHTFGVAESFPQTGFIGASFTLNVTGSASDYTWDNGGSSWATVDDNGNVTFTAQGDATPVTITAISRDEGKPLAYTFSVNNWFFGKGTMVGNWDYASNVCSAGGLTLPTRAELTKGTDVRGIGSLWSEWGNLNKYPGAATAFAPYYYWTSEQSSASQHYVFFMGTGATYSYTNSYSNVRVMCR